MAIDAATDCTDPLDDPITVDQRGVARPQGSACDAGSFELESGEPSPTPTPTPSPTATPSPSPTPTPIPTPRTLVVNAADDPGEGLCDPSHCTLREAILNAASGDTIAFDLAAPSTIALSSGQLTIDKNLTITGPGANILSVSGNGISRVFRIPSGVTTSVSGLTLSNGRADGADGFGGGGIFNDGNLKLTEVAISGNSSAVVGGGIVNNGALLISNSTISGNIVAETGGGIHNGAGGTLSLINITVSGNSAISGGGIFNGGGTLTVSNGTFSSNSAFSGAILSGSGVFKNSIFVGLLLDSCDTPITNQGGNLTTGDGCGGVLVSPQLLKLTPLTDNGGPTQTHALLSGSLAIDALSDCTDVDGNPVSTDQRGVARPQGAKCDVGSFERRSVDFGKLSATTLETPQETDYSDVVTLRSTTIVEGLPVTDGTVEFFVNNLSIGTATLANDGTAAVSTQILLAPGSYPVIAIFTSSQLNIAGSHATSTLVVTREEAMFIPKASNPNLVLVSGGVFSGTFGRFCFDTVEEADGSLGYSSLEQIATYAIDLEGYSGQWQLTSGSRTGGNGQPGFTCWNLELTNAPAGNYTLKLWFPEWSYYTGSFSSSLQIADPASLKADLLVGLGVDKQDVKQGELLTYTITVRNFGPEQAINVLVNDVLSSGTTFVSAAANRGRFTAPVSGQSGTVSWYPGDLANNSEESAKISVTVIVKGNTTITNTATVSAISSDPNMANNTASITSNVVLKSGGGGGGSGGGGSGGGGPKPR